MAPAAVLLEQLAAARRTGATFEAAWPDAFTAALQAADPLEREEWADVLGGMVTTWRHGFDRQEFDRRACALRAVAEDPARVPLSEAELAELQERVCPPLRRDVTRDPAWCSGALLRLEMQDAGGARAQAARRSGGVSRGGCRD